MDLASAGRHRIGEQAEVQHVQGKVRGDGGGQPAKAVGKAVAESGQGRQQHPLPAGIPMGRLKNVAESNREKCSQ